MPAKQHTREPPAGKHWGFGRSWIAPLLLVAGAFISLFWLVHPYYDAYPDSSMYIVTARSILAGEGYSYLGAPFTLRPPGFPLLLSPVLITFGTDFLALNLYMGLIGVLCLLLFFLHARPRLGGLVAFAAAASLWLNPGFQRTTTRVMSDVPAAASLLLCLLVERWARRVPSLGRDVLVGLCVALSVYVRTIDIVILPAILLSRLFGAARPPVLEGTRYGPACQAAVLIGIPLLLLSPWALRNSAVEASGAEVRTKHHSYWVGMRHTDPGDPDSPEKEFGEILERIPQRVVRNVAMLGDRMSSSASGTIPLVLGTVGLLCLTWVAVRRREAAELLALGLFFALVLYKSGAADALPGARGGDARLVLPIYVLALPAVLEVLLLFIGGRVRSPLGQSIAVACLALLTLHDADLRSHWTRIAQQHRDRAAFSSHLASSQLPETPLAAHVGWHYSVYLDRPVHTLKFAWLREGSAGAERILDKNEVDVVLLEIGQPSSRELLEYLSSEYVVKDRFGRHQVVRIRRDPVPGFDSGPVRDR